MKFNREELLEKYWHRIDTNTLSGLDMNDFWKAQGCYCEGKKEEDFVPSRRFLNVDKKEIIIFEADYEKINMDVIKNNNRKELLMPTDKIFIEIPRWQIRKDKVLYINIGGVYICNERVSDVYKTTLDPLTNKQQQKLAKSDFDVITVYSLWLIYDTENEHISFRPISMGYREGIPPRPKPMKKEDITRVGSSWANPMTHIRDMDFEIKKELSERTSELLHYLLHKIEKKEYLKYKKWTPTGAITKDIVYSHEVSKHKRHFWKDSGKFKIPLMGKEGWESKGYGTHELVFRDGELRRDVPYRVIGNYLMGDEGKVPEDNRRIKLAKGRVWRCEEKIYKILKELYPDKIIRRHDRKTLKGLELDFNLPELRLGIEYDGEQHFDRKLCEDVFKSDFDAQVSRDREKDKLCRRKNIKLIRIKYDQPLTKTNLRKLIAIPNNSS